VFLNGQRKGGTPTEPGKALVLKLREGQYRLEGPIDVPRLRWERRDLYVAAEAIQPVKLVLAAVEPEMVSIPAGAFLMGSNSLGDSSFLKWEQPLHSVNVPGFAIGKYEVTFAEWDACVADDGCTHTPGDEGWGRGNPPVINVSWNDAQQYVAWLSRKTGKPYRLPSEAEWEYAARAGTTAAYSTGEGLGRDRANYGSAYDSEIDPTVLVGRTRPVGSYAANPWGLYDVHGNVDELVEDCWSLMNNYSDTPTDGSAYAQKFGNCSSRVVRGGSWANPAFFPALLAAIMTILSYLQGRTPRVEIPHAVSVWPSPL
jgi:formylglycine-generating enzyme required for sulfatase activity